MMAKFLRKGALFLALSALLTVTAHGAEKKSDAVIASTQGIGDPAALSDASRSSYTAASAGAEVTLSCPEGISAVYIEFDRLPGDWTIRSGEKTAVVDSGFLHAWADVEAMLGEKPAEVTLSFEEDTRIADIYGFSGEAPQWVQKWEKPEGEADLLLFSSHSDDEQLFFAGVLPYYAVERQLEVQVAYVVQHFHVGNSWDHQRPHEQLDGLWTVGVRRYPVMSEFPDLYSEAKGGAAEVGAAKRVYQNAGYTYEDFLEYFVATIRRFSPLVVVSHDFDGEYGHGTHVLAAAGIKEAIAAAADGTQFPESAAEYGPWQVEKAYSHLYEENPIVMDWDTPYESLGGRTPFEVTQDGFACHKSQHWTWFYKWIYGKNGAVIEKAADIATYSPCLYGLYHTTVGVDAAGGDFFENVKSYAQRAQEEAERLAAEEAARLAAEEEAKRLAAEEAARLAAEEAARIAAEEAAARKKTMMTAAGLGLLAAIGAWMVLRRRKS